MDKEKNLADYIMRYIAQETGAKNLNVAYHEWRINDREDGDELIGIDGVRVRYNDMDYEYSMQEEYFKTGNVDEILNKHMPDIKEWMSKYVEPTN